MEPHPSAGKKRLRESLLGISPSVELRCRHPSRTGAEKVTRVTNVRILRGGKLSVEDLWYENGKFVDPQARFWASETANEFDPDEIIDGNGMICAPGFVDIQLNGAFGIDFSSPDITQEAVQRVARGLLAHGVTAFCPTVVSSLSPTYRAILPRFRRTPSSAANGAAVLGLHLEGPFMHPDKKGAHDIAAIHAPEKGLQSVMDCYGTLDNVSIVTLAPELPGSLDAIKALHALGVVVSSGHCMADIRTAALAKKQGANLITHLFNAMPAFHHRDPGLVGLLGTMDQPYYGIICDGIHCHPASVKMAYAAHKHGVILVTDAMAALGLEPGLHKLGQMNVQITTDRAVIDQTDTLAGSIISMDRCVRGFREYTGCSVEEALLAASLHPAAALGLDKKKGSLSFGADADFVLLDDDLVVHATYVAGELGWQRSAGCVAPLEAPKPDMETPAHLY
jgi:N-acetylglucosamine-6-phosphate deacetylase